MPPAATLLAAQLTEIAVIVGSTAIVADADLVESCILVAVTVTDVPVEGAVSTPAGEMAPAEARQVTAVEMLPVPCTDALQGAEVPAATFGVAQETEMLVTVAAGEVVTVSGSEPLWPLTQE